MIETASHQLINQSSGDVEIYTPSNIIEAARQTLGTIDLDPASSEIANRRVKAETFYGEPPFSAPSELNGLPVRIYMDRGGLDCGWRGNVWMNHPFGTACKACAMDCDRKNCHKRGYHYAVDHPGNTDWIQKIITEYRERRMSAGCAITFASTSEAWFRPLLRYPQCFLSPRTNYLRPDGTIYKGVTKGSCVTYFGKNTALFAESFRHLGEVKVPFFNL